jgi:hypothetical protein
MRTEKNNRYEYLGFNAAVTIGTIEPRLVFLFVRKNDGIIVSMIEYIEEEIDGEYNLTYKITHDDTSQENRKITHTFKSLEELEETGTAFGNIYGQMRLRDFHFPNMKTMFSLGYDEDMFEEVLQEDSRIQDLVVKTDFLTSIDELYILKNIRLEIAIDQSSLIKTNLNITL